MYKGNEWRSFYAKKKQTPEEDGNTHIAVAQAGKNPKPQTNPPKPPGSKAVRIPVIQGNPNGRVRYARCYKGRGWVIHQKSGKIRRPSSVKANRKTNKGCSGEN